MASASANGFWLHPEKENREITNPFLILPHLSHHWLGWDQ